MDEKETKPLTLHDESSGCACRLLNLLLQYQDTLSLFWWQHGDLFWGQLQYLHNQGSLGMWKHSSRLVSTRQRPCYIMRVLN